MLRKMYNKVLYFLIGRFGKPKGAIPKANSLYLAICCIIKDENEYLKEWLEYHLKIGVQHFFLYDNESKTPLITTVEQLNLSKHVTVILARGKETQYKAYRHCLKEFGPTSQWVAVIDGDEFIVPKQPKGDLPAFLKSYEAYGAVGINWQVFGSSGHQKKTNKPQLESFLLRAEDNLEVNRHIKSIVQPKYVTGMLNPHAFAYVEGKYCVNENFLPVENAWVDVSIQKAQINHYYCRSEEEYEAKIQRGFADSGNKRSMDDFYRHDKDANKVQDSTILEILATK